MNPTGYAAGPRWRSFHKVTTLMSSLQLRPYQEQSVESLRDGFRSNHTRQVLAAPTGAGKSRIMEYMIRAAMDKGSRVMFICERRILVEQFSAHLDRAGIDHGVLMAGHWRFRPDRQVQIASAQTLERMQALPRMDIVFIDELHASMRKSIINLIERNPKLRIIGATATPFHPAIGLHFTNVVSVTTMSQLVKEEFLVPFRVFVAKEIDTKGLKVVAGEWKKDDLEKRGQQIVGDVVADYIRISNDVFGGYRKTICFSCGIAHGAELAQKFNEAGINAVQISSEDDEEYRTEVLRDFAKPDTDIKIVISVAILSRGFDQSDVDYVILARPLKKSFSEHVQMVGRGARIHPGKTMAVIQDNCVAAGSKILTHRGLVPVELILLSDKIWDGHDFVQHRGAISRGKKPVITYAGLTATRDHRVKTAKAWRTFGECSDEQTPIVTTGIGGAKVFERSNYFTAGRFTWEEGTTVSACFSGVRKLWLSLNNFLLKSHERRIQGVPPVQPNGQAHPSLPELAFCTGYVNEDPMREGNARQLRKLRRTWDSLRVRFSKSRGNLDIGELGDTRGLQKSGAGQDRERRELRPRQSSVGDSREEYGQSPKFSHDPKDAQVHAGKPAGQVRSRYAQAIAFCWHVFRGHRGAVQQAELQAEREVWDILDCGPRNSFTCEGLLVHNCGNWVRFQDDWDKLYHDGVQELGQGQDAKPKKEPTQEQKEAAKCPKCSVVWSGGGDTCLNCGHVRVKRNEVQAVAGEMVEIGMSKRKEEKFTAEYKSQFYAQLLGYANERGYQAGWAYHSYKDKFGAGPSMAKPIPEPPSNLVRNWVTSQNIRKSKAYMKGVAA